MVPWGMAFAAKPHDLSLFSGTHMVEREKTDTHKLSSDFPRSVMAYASDSPENIFKVMK